ncbi:ATP-binding protein [Streptomyces sp. NPDC101490]|uniref:ATP-binding protein n=1 Tax=Streptomyces sp. NPDC101490 TaxID=3366143 RepID=UPI00380C364D
MKTSCAPSATETTCAPPTSPCVVHRALPADPSAVGQARRTAGRLLGSYGRSCPEGVAADFLLVVSELATNAFLHAAPPYALTVTVEEGRAGVTVSDRSRAGPGRPRVHEDLSSHKRGLEIVEALGAEVRVSRSRRGKQVTAVLTWPPRSGDRA